MMKAESGTSLGLLKGAWIVFVVLLAANYFPTFKWMVMRWNEDNSYSSHGWLIPFVTAWLLWGLRDQLRAVPLRPSRWGAPLVVLALLIHALSGLADVSSLSGFSMILLIGGFAVLTLGWKWSRTAWFPLATLLFMVPLPDFIISNLNFKLKLVAADFAARMLNITGLPAIHAGSFLLFEDQKLAVGDVCSGLRSLLSLIALGAIYAWLMRDRGKSLVIPLLIAILPAAIFGNGLRIYIVSLLVYFLGSETVFHPLIGSMDLHLLTGGIIFIGAFTVLYAITLVHEAVAIRIAKPTPGVPA